MTRNHMLLVLMLAAPACATQNPAGQAPNSILGEVTRDLLDDGHARFGEGEMLSAPIVHGESSGVALRADDHQDILFVTAQGRGLTAKRCRLRHDPRAGLLFLDLEQMVASDGMRMGSVLNVPLMPAPVDR